MKKTSAQNTSARNKLALRRETIQQLTVAQLGDVEGGATINRSDGEAISCVATHCTGVSLLCSILQPC
jgi:hypothetical protein